MQTIRKSFRKICHLIVRKMSTESFKGVEMSAIYGGRDAFDLEHLPPVENKRDHFVLYKLPIAVSLTRPPEPFRGESKWDPNHVRMPYNPQSVMQNENTVMRKRNQIEKLQ